MNKRPLKIVQELEIHNLQELYDLVNEEKLSGVPDLSDNDYELPCYVQALTTTQRLGDKHPVSPSNYLSLVAAQTTKNTPLLVFSITTKEKGYEKWLEAANTYPGTQIQEVVREISIERGKKEQYTCYFVTINFQFS